MGWEPVSGGVARAIVFVGVDTRKETATGVEDDGSAMGVNDEGRGTGVEDAGSFAGRGLSFLGGSSAPDPLA